ncbi:MAG TPA: hypothetical protein VFO16_14240 [Pseudonocardiaceae bacterium]|nr:hypothetical protein [Pseudonocardiaceae bacterium]
MPPFPTRSSRPNPLRRRPRVAGRRYPADRPAPGGISPPRRHRIAAQAALIAVLVTGLVLAVWFRSEAKAQGDAAAVGHRALLAQVTGQVREGVERVFSYDFTRLDDNERAAAAVITGAFARDYPRQFARVRELAPGQQAVVVATVPALAVKVLDGDRAIVVVFIDQQATRGGQAAPLLAAGRLRVTAQRVDDSWKLAGVQPF